MTRKSFIKYNKQPGYTQKTYILYIHLTTPIIKLLQTHKSGVINKSWRFFWRTEVYSHVFGLVHDRVAVEAVAWKGYHVILCDDSKMILV